MRGYRTLGRRLRRVAVRLLDEGAAHGSPLKAEKITVMAGI
jgi:hypothetical protein